MANGGGISIGKRRAEAGVGAASRAFTLIELLVVVAIIAILAAIAVPNFLEAQTRAKVSRVLNDMRTLATGLEAYSVDFNQPPRRTTPPSDDSAYVPYFPRQYQDMAGLTTPIAYLSVLPQDIFARGATPRPYLIDYYDPVHTDRFVRWYRGEYLRNPNQRKRAEEAATNYMLSSVGPDGYFGVFSPAYAQVYGLPVEPRPLRSTMWMVYDPTNGTVSVGNIYRFRNQQDPASVLRRD